MTGKWILVSVAALVPALAAGQDADKTVCTLNDWQRRVEIVRETGVEVPCEVHYYKDTESPGERQVLWRANSQAGYCEERARGFVAELEGWGWNCGRAVEADAMPEPVNAPIQDAPVQDDTAALSPADEQVPEQQ